MLTASRSLRCLAALTCGSVLVCSPLRAAPPSGDAAPTAPVADQDVKCTLSIGPVEGLTLGWHPAPLRTAIPVGKDVLFLVTKLSRGDVTWTNAVEVFEDTWGSVALVPLGAAGDIGVRAELVTDDGLGATLACDLAVSSIMPDQLEVTGIEWSADDLGLSDPPWNYETMRAYFGESVAALTPAGERTFLTSIDRTVVARASLSHPEFLPLMEWRLEGEPAGLGPVFMHSFTSADVHHVDAGPPDRARLTKIRTFRTTITRHTANGFIYDGQPVTYTAVTDPPGFEQHVSWLASTKYGYSEPVTGSGPEFTTTFFKSSEWEYEKDGSVFQWLGVKGDNDADGQDAKSVCPFTFPYDGQDHPILRHVFLLDDNVMRISLDAGAPAPVVIVATAPGGADIPLSQITLDPGRSIVYGVDNAQSYTVRAPALPGEPEGVVCAEQPGELNGVTTVQPNGCAASTPAVPIALLEGAGLLSFVAKNNSNCVVAVRFRNPAAGGTVLQTTNIRKDHSSVVEYNNTDPTITVIAEFDCPDTPNGDCGVTTTGRAYRLPDATANEHVFLNAVTMDDPDCEDAHVNEVLKTNLPGNYVLTTAVPLPPAGQQPSCPIVVSVSVAGGPLVPDFTVAPGKSTTIDFKRSLPAQIVVSYHCMDAGSSHCRATVSVQRTVLTTFNYPPVTVTNRPCGETDTLLINDVSGVINGTLSVGAVPNECPVEISATRDGAVIAGFPLTIAAGGTFLVNIRNPAAGGPAAPTDVIIITARCTAPANGKCNYGFTSGRTPLPP